MDFQKNKGYDREITRMAALMGYNFAEMCDEIIRSEVNFDADIVWYCKAYLTYIRGD